MNPNTEENALSDLSGDPIKGWLEEHVLSDTDFILADGFDEAFMGYAESHASGPTAVYDMDKVLKILERDMSRIEALEYFNFNIIAAAMGPATPIFLKRYDARNLN
tara:strand:- start:462 stop:779 length:318 start_codon:yes stop_codon:yes gene_type:complete